MKEIILVIFLSVSLIQSYGQNQTNADNVNIVKNTVFVSNGNCYPLTLLICPYGYWEYGQIRSGLNNFNNIKYLVNQNFSWLSGGIRINTPTEYVFDTLNIDTLKSPFNILNYHNRLVNDTNSIEYKINNFIKFDFKYSYLIQGILINKSKNEYINIIYSDLSKSGYKENFHFVSLEIFGDSIKMNSADIFVSNLINKKIIYNGSVFLNRKESKKLLYKIVNINFKDSLDCYDCTLAPYNQLNFIIDYNNQNNHKTYIMCNLLQSNNKNQEKTIDYLKGLKNTIVKLNEKYFMRK